MLALLKGTELPIWLDWARALATIATPIVLGLIGGVFAFYRYRKERAHARRVQPTIEHEIGYRGDMLFLSVSVFAENIGSTKVDVDSEHSVVRIYTRTAREDHWWPYQTESVFATREWIEPGEKMGDTVWFEIFKWEWVAIKIESYVASKKRQWLFPNMRSRRLRGWLASKVVNLAATEEDEGD